jgi:chemotaxis signal transduction protein
VDANDFEGLGRIRTLLEEVVAADATLTGQVLGTDGPDGPDASAAHALALLDRVILREVSFDESITSVRSEIESLLASPAHEPAREVVPDASAPLALDATAPPTRPGPGKYLGFLLAGTEYGLDVRTVREIVGMQDITAVPRAPATLKGVINLRGQVIPVIELRARFGLPVTSHGPETCIVVIEHHGELVGLLVDRVAEVVNIAEENISPPPHFSSESAEAFGSCSMWRRD